jgi:hypothetical protein
MLLKMDILSKKMSNHPNVQFNTGNENAADTIDNLPVDQTVPSHNEVHIVDTLFKQKHGTIQKIMAGTKDMLLAGFLFILLNIPQIEGLIKKVIPIADTSIYILLLIKTVLFIASYFILKNLYLVRK